MEWIETNEAATSNILIVDDDADTCKLLELLFSRKGYHTLVAGSGEEALAQVQECQPDICVLDVMMPGIDGWETFERMRAIANFPVLFLTALTSGESVARALTYEANDYLPKPFHPNELVTRVGALLKNGNRVHSNVETKSGLPFDPTALNPPDFKIEHYKAIAGRVVVVIPAYNEERFIGSVVLETRRFADTVIVVDDGSSDDTAEIAAQAGARVLRHAGNQGKAAALNTAFQAAREYTPEVVVTLDADGQHLPDELDAVVEPILRGEADVVIGSRYLEPTSQVPRHRILGHWFFNELTRAASGVKASDSQSGYRAFSPRALFSAEFHSQGFAVESEMQFIAGEQSLRVIEVPITIRYTDKPKRSVIQQGLQVLNGVLRLTCQYRPLFYFGLPGLGLFLAGLGWGLVVVDRYTRTHELAVGYALICVLLSVIGLIMTSTAFTLHSIRGLLIDRIGNDHQK